MSGNADKALAELVRKSLVPEQKHSALAQLLRTIPGIYREKDNGDSPESGDLGVLLGTFGDVLDGLRDCLYARLDDTSPYTCQPWLIPYFADLLDIQLVSPDLTGQRQEIGEAISWRQRKGTLGTAVTIAEAVGQFPVIAFEGHNSVARTPRVDQRQPTLREIGEASDGAAVSVRRSPNATRTCSSFLDGMSGQGKVTCRGDLREIAGQFGPCTSKRRVRSCLLLPSRGTSPSIVAARPGTPAVTVDFRKISRPKRISDDDPTPLSIKSRFGNDEIRWQHESAPHGVPPYLDGYQDVAMRTPDMRDGNWEHGHHHPKRLRLYTPVPEGFVCAPREWKISNEACKCLNWSMGAPDVRVDRYKKQNGYLYWLRIDPREPAPGECPSGLRYLRIEERRAPEASFGGSGLLLRSTLITVKSLPGKQPELPEAWRRLWESEDTEYFDHWPTYFDQRPELYLMQREHSFSLERSHGLWNMYECCPGVPGEAVAIGADALRFLVATPSNAAIDEPTRKDVGDYICVLTIHRVPVQPNPKPFQYVRIEEQLLSREDSSLVRVRTSLVTTLATDSALPAEWQQFWDSNDTDYLKHWDRYFDDKPNLYLVQWEHWAEDERSCGRLRGGTWNMLGGCLGTVGEPVTGRPHIFEQPRWPTLDASVAVGTAPCATGDEVPFEVPDKALPMHVEVLQVVISGTLKLRAAHTLVSQCAIQNLTATSIGATSESQVSATDCLVDSWNTPGLAALLEYCTVNQGLACAELRASDSILLGPLSDVSGRLMLRFCAAPHLAFRDIKASDRIFQPSIPNHVPHFYGQDATSRLFPKLISSSFGARGFGVLHQRCHDSIRQGAEDGGELGAFHHRRHCGRQDAVVTKLKDCLPAGTTAVLIVDPYWSAPPKEQP